MPLPLNPISAEEPFQQWGLDFIGEINLNSFGRHRWILNATDYFTKWIKSIPTRRDTDAMIMYFWENNMFSRFGCLRILVTNNAKYFKSKKMIISSTIPYQLKSFYCILSSREWDC